MFYVMLALRAELRERKFIRGQARSRTSPRYATWSRSARSPTWCRSTRTTASSSRRGSSACAPAQAKAGLAALARAGGPRRRRDASCFDLGFILGPRLNAAGPARRHGPRHRVPDHRRRGARRELRAGARPPEPRAPQDRRRNAGRGERRAGRHCANPPGATHDAVPARLAPGRGRADRVARAGALAPAGRLLCEEQMRASCAARAARSRASTCATRSTSSPSARRD